MNDNPLTMTVIIFLICDAYTAWEALSSGSISLITILAWLQLAILIVLYSTLSDGG
jgi:hypothetical protein